VGPQSSANFGDHCVIKLVFTQINSAQLFLMGDTFAESFAKSLGKFVLTDIQVFKLVKSLEVLEEGRDC
jgi:hypothetical protein